MNLPKSPADYSRDKEDNADLRKEYGEAENHRLRRVCVTHTLELRLPADALMSPTNSLIFIVECLRFRLTVHFGKFLPEGTALAHQAEAPSSRQR